MRFVVTALIVLALLPALPARAQFKDEPIRGGAQLGEAGAPLRLRVGIVVQASGGMLFNLAGSTAIPTDWPEQTVEIVEEDVSALVKDIAYRNITGGGGVKQLAITIPQLPSGQEAKAIVTVEVTRRALLPPADTSGLRIPKKLSRELSLNVGPSPYIEVRHPKIMAAAKEAAGEHESAWQRVEAIYDWVRANIKFTNGELKGASRTLLEKEGDFEDLTGLFIALCRAQKIPARTVFLTDDCYAEFYLEDASGQGHWFPCQPAGQRAFGTVVATTPIMQKGDNFKNPDNAKERLRRVKEDLHGAGKAGKGKPKVTFIRELVASQPVQQLAPTD